MSTPNDPADLAPSSGSCLQRNLRAAQQTLATLGELEPALGAAAALLIDCLRGGGKLLTCGNGGSAADAAHLATEFVVRFVRERPAYPAICLNDFGSTLTAAGNDYGFEYVFARQVEAFGKPGDVLIAFTTSGDSGNVVRAIETARQRQMKTVTFLGRGGGTCAGMADVELLVRSPVTARVQEAHLLLYHSLCEMVEAALAEGG